MFFFFFFFQAEDGIRDRDVTGVQTCALPIYPWRHGWQPMEVAREVRRSANVATAGLSLMAIAADHANRVTSTLDSRWVAQLDDLDLPPVAAGDGWLAEWGRQIQLTWPEQVRSVVSLLAT